MTYVIYTLKLTIEKDDKNPAAKPKFYYTNQSTNINKQTNKKGQINQSK